MLKGVRLEDIHLKQESVDRMIDEKQFFQLVEKDEFPKEGNCNLCGRCGPRDPEFIALCYYDRMDEECIGRVANPKTRLEFMDGFPTITHQHMDRESINRKNDEFAAEQLEKYFKANPKHRK